VRAKAEWLSYSTTIFAVTLNLNTGDYEGGALRFPEFATAPFEAPAGGAVVFSCSLLHEAFPVTRGRRFGLFTFLFDDAGAAHVRQMLAAEAQRRPDFTSGAAVRRS
jgi:predicted 2-oxoglutarate/Fe(II)-dependent dioxygenase YbiX